MSEYVEINGQAYEDLTAGFDANGNPIDGIYYGLPAVSDAPMEGLRTVNYAKVAFPGTFDGVATVELSYAPRPLACCLAIIGSLGTVATLKEGLNAVLVRDDAARYTVAFPGRSPRPGCKLESARELKEINLGGKILLPIYCTFEQLSDAN